MGLAVMQCSAVQWNTYSNLDDGSLLYLYRLVFLIDYCEVGISLKRYGRGRLRRTVCQSEEPTDRVLALSTFLISVATWYK